MMKSLCVPAAASLALALAALVPAWAEEPRVDFTPAPEASVAAYFSDWFDRVNRAQSEQPHWIAPLVTVTPLLIEQVRYDQFWENLGNGSSLDNYDNGKGVELVPTGTNEVQVGAPPYLRRTGKSNVEGFGDWPFLLLKQRLASANEQNGNYVVTLFLSAQADSGVEAFTNRAWIITPTLAGGFGFGNFDVQATAGLSVPTGHETTLGVPLAINAVAQYHLLTYLWPEFEVNYTHWFDGLRGGKDQVFLTPGIVLGRFQIHDRVTASIGGGYQFAVSPPRTISPVLTPLYDHAWILSARVTF